MSNPHDGHRERLKNRFLHHGLDSLDDHNALELLLFFSVPRRDTNQLAHTLIKRFGSLAEVFDAPLNALLQVDGIGKSSALLIKLVPQLSRRYLISRTAPDKHLLSTRQAGEYISPYFFAERDEVVYLVCLDAKGKVLACQLMFRGSVNSASINIRRLVETALSFNSTSVILAHNHTSGIPTPSPEDISTTHRIAEALAAVDITLTDHIVVADTDFVSFADNNFFK